MTGGQYAPDLFEKEALGFIREKRDKPFFLFYATTIPHLALQVPEDSLAEYKGRWPETPYDGKNGYQPQPTPRAAYAAMVTRFDRSVGRVLALLREQGIEDDTLVLFASDNGATFDIGGFDADFFQSTGGLRRVQGLRLRRRHPGAPDRPLARPDQAGVDFRARLRLSGLFPDPPRDGRGYRMRVPAGLDGLSFAPSLYRGAGRKPRHDRLYMEYKDYGGQQMAMWGDWKGVRQGVLKNPAAPIELYDLTADPGETRDLAADKPDIVRRLAEIMKAEHKPSTVFPFPGLDAGK